ncbi:SMC-Scp complex subunit ScpB [Hyphomonas sp.]|uniref:SMC-Scp complex subunit ScpB n=1 Tax=Hyphomonas sp. TaxID=87 RepID=UPI0025C2CB7E|nr:SMC-Scp complex subunit ScpB [Hyphomonas sp.]
MQPSETFKMTHDTADNRRDAMSQLSEAQARAEADLLGGRDAALAEGVRRAEAVLFAAGESLSAEQVAEILPQGIEAGEVLMALRAVYSKRGVNLIEVAGKWRFQTAQDLSYLFVEERQVQKKLGQAALETMAIIAYGQPVTRAEIEAVRGVAVAKSVIDTLLETGWVRVRGRRKTPGLPITYGTTDKFLEHFGLESLDTLPGKADLEAEGLLTDVIPSGFQMPDEEALSEEDMLIGELGNVEDVEAFVTDFMGDEAIAPVTEQAASTPVAGDGDDEEETGGGLSVFAYTRAPKPEADPEAFDREAIQAAVRKLRGETRMPQQPMHTWRDDE